MLLLGAVIFSSPSSELGTVLLETPSALGVSKPAVSPYNWKLKNMFSVKCWELNSPENIPAVPCTEFSTHIRFCPPALSLPCRMLVATCVAITDLWTLRGACFRFSTSPFPRRYRPSHTVPWKCFLD